MENPPTIINFKFRYANAKGRPSTTFRKCGSFDGETLTLDNTKLPVIVIARVFVRFGRLVLLLVQKDGSAKPVVLLLSGKTLESILPALTKSISSRRAALRRDYLARNNKSVEFHSETCPHCSAEIDLSGRKPTPQAYCPYCDTIVTLEGDRPSEEAKYHLCDHCGLYSQPRTFTVFYFYFLLVLYGFYSKQVHRCHSCMRAEAWKMLAGNFLFLLGLPVAITQLCRVYLGGSRMSKAFTGLDNANARANKRKVDLAVQEYQKIEERLLCCAGVRYNHGQALARVERIDEAAGIFQDALEDCSNYVPAFESLCACLKSLNRTRELETVQSQWRLGDERSLDGSHSIAEPAMMAAG